MLEIPITSQPEQIFTIATEFGTREIRIIANLRLEKWTMSFYSVVDGVSAPIITGISLLPGTNIIKQYPEILQDAMIIANLDDYRDDPTLDNLGTVCKLIFLDAEELVVA